MRGGSTPPGAGSSTLELVFVLGIDPGVSRCGYGCVDRRVGGLSAVAAGVITTDTAAPLPERLADLAGELRSLIGELRPAAVAVERVFFQTNARTAMSVGQASGLALAAAAHAGCDVEQYTPNEVKQAVTGYGSANKDQVQRMVAVLLGLPEPPAPSDAADALALAICHLTVAPRARRIEESRQAVGRGRVAARDAGDARREDAPSEDAPSEAARGGAP